MSFKKSEEELRILTDAYASEIRNTSSDLPNTKYILSDLWWDNDWNSLFHEPVFQILFQDYDDEMVDVDQFMICRDIKGFSREDDDEDEFVKMYKMKESESAILFDMFIKDFLESAELASPLQIQEALNYNKNIVDIMFEIGYIERFDLEEKLAVFELTDDVRFVNEEAKDMFLF